MFGRMGRNANGGCHLGKPATKWFMGSVFLSRPSFRQSLSNNRQGLSGAVCEVLGADPSQHLFTVAGPPIFFSLCSPLKGHGGGTRNIPHTHTLDTVFKITNL